MTGDEVRHGDIVGGENRLVAETQVASREAAGFLRVILEIGLDILIGVVADNLAGVLVGADGSVGTQAPELAGDDALSGGHDVLAHRQRVEGDVVVDADGEVVLLLAGHVVEDGLDLRRRRVLGAQAVAAAEDRQVQPGFQHRGADILKERLAQRTGFLGAVKDRKDPAGGRDRRGKVLQGEGAVQMNLDQTDLFALCVQIIHHLTRRITDRAHGNDDALCIRGAEVVEEMIVSAGEGGDLFHVFLHQLLRMVGCSGFRAWSRNFLSSSQSTSFAMSSKSRTSIFWISWLVRKPSKKCCTGT